MKWPMILISLLSLIVLTAYDPRILSDNRFLTSIISHEILPILVVILTVTMASVANIHLAMGRMKSSLLAKGVDISAEIADARREVSENAWVLFGSFCICVIVLFIKGAIEDSEYTYISICNSAVILVFVLNLVILYDIYGSIYALTSLDEPAVHNGQANDGAEPLNEPVEGPVGA